MGYVEGLDREQGTLLPNRVADYVNEDNPVRVIDAFVDSLDMRKLGFKKAKPAETGRPAYDPKDLTKLYMYGYFNKVRSSRKLMTECGRNLEVIYLLRGLQPDFRTIANFRRDNPKALREVFREFVRLCDKLGLYRKKLLAVDGSKFRAHNSDDRCFNKDILEKKLAGIDEHLKEYMGLMDSADREDDGDDTEKQPSAEEIKAAVAELSARKEKYEGYIDELAETGNTQILETDPEAHRMHTKDGFHCCYNVQTAVDGGSHLIAEYEVTNHNTDQGLLSETAAKAKELLEVEAIEAVADKGYESREDILNCVMNGTVPNVAFKYDKEERVYSLDYEPAEITEEERSSTKPENIQKCIHAGVLPRCHENTAISIEVQNENEALGCFCQNGDGTVTCPMGHTLTAVRRRRENHTRYANKDACRQCVNRCTRSHGAKFVEFTDGTEYIAARMYGKMPPINPLPTGAKLNPNNHVLDRKNPKPARVMLTLRPDRAKLRERMCLSEHPFGTVKWYGGAHYVLCNGIEKVTGEIALSFLAYNLRHVLNILGTTALLAGIRG